jgi:hypothetical protein
MVEGVSDQGGGARSLGADRGVNHGARRRGAGADDEVDRASAWPCARAGLRARRYKARQLAAGLGVAMLLATGRLLFPMADMTQSGAGIGAPVTMAADAVYPAGY